MEKSNMEKRRSCLKTAKRALEKIIEKTAKKAVKRLLLTSLVVALVLGIYLLTTLYANDNIGVIIDGQQMDFGIQQPTIADDRIFVPRPSLRPNEVQVSPHLEGVIFNAQFLSIPTYEGSGQVVHPHVLFFEEKFMGYHYIMVITPYPFSNERHENPSILGSQDGFNWEVPEGVINPVVGTPFDVRHGGYFSDPFIFRRDDTLELWFRHTLATYQNGQFVQRNRHNRIYRTVSNDLVNWSDFEIFFDCPNYIDAFMSPVIMYNNGKYRVWYTHFTSALFYIESYDRINWTPRRQIIPNLGGLGIWHHDIVFTGGKYEALFTSADWGNEPVFRLFYATSYDGIEFDRGREICIRSISPELEGLTVHKSTFVRTNGIYQMYIAVFSSNEEWSLFYFEIPEEQLYKLFVDYLDWDNGTRIALISAEPTMPQAYAKISGEQYITVETALNLQRNPIDPSRPMIAITFDDGPSISTMQVLDVFEAHGERATFFVIGGRIDGFYEIIERMHRNGFEVLGHSWSHPHLTLIPEEEIANEILLPHEIIEDIIGPIPRMFRPPFGEYDRTVREVAGSLDFAIIHWSVCAEDFGVIGNPGPDSGEVVNRVLRDIQDGDIVLLHDMHPPTVIAIERLVPELIAMGYQLVTVSELFYHRGVILEAGAVYRRALP